MRKFVSSVWLAAALLLCAPPGARAAEDEIVIIDTRPGVTISFAVSRPDGAPRAAAILLIGGNGKLRLWRNRGVRSRNFLARSRELFAERGVLAVTVDVPSDRHKEGLTDFRGTEDHRADMAAVVRWARANAKAPLWLIGTSRGTVSQGYLTGALPVDGAVFTSTVTRAGRRNPSTVFDGDLDSVKVPVLLVHHKEDRCRVTPVDELPGLAARLRNAPKVETLLFEGGSPPESQACRALSAHGYLGIEEKVVSAIVRWMTAALPR